MLKVFRPHPAKETKIKAILFDIGGVMVKDEYYPFFKNFESATGMTKEELYLDLVKSQELIDYELGSINSEQFWKRVGEKYKIKREILGLIRKFWPTVLIPIPGMGELVQGLRKNYVVGAISNIGSEMAGYLQQTYNTYELFD